uniref:Uncharacterized protein n=1 Tax=Anguilla anguilla TaxID=7936 RepID=A0A0E9XER2_ANGAN
MQRISAGRSRRKNVTRPVHLGGSFGCSGGGEKAFFFCFFLKFRFLL